MIAAGFGGGQAGWMSASGVCWHWWLLAVDGCRGHLGGTADQRRKQPLQVAAAPPGDFCYGRLCPAVISWCYLSLAACPDPAGWLEHDASGLGWRSHRVRRDRSPHNQRPRTVIVG